MILTNPRYTGRQVWNRQSKQEILLGIDDVAAGYETKFKWNEPGSWIWSDGIAHDPLVSVEDFETVQAIRVQRRKNNPAEPLQRMQRPSRRDYVLRGLLRCAICGRKMESTFNHDRPHYRCRYAGEYAAANKIEQPPAVYVHEDMIVPHLDKWLCKILAPHRIDQTAQALADASTHDDHVPVAEAARRVPGRCRPEARPASGPAGGRHRSGARRRMGARSRDREKRHQRQAARAR